MKPGRIVKVRIDLWSTSLIFNKGHRIAVHVSSSNDPRFDPNPNTGKRLRQDTETRAAANAGLKASSGLAERMSGQINSRAANRLC